MNDFDPLSLDFATRYPDSFARVLGRGDASEAARILERLPADRKAAIVARLPGARIGELLASDRHRPAEWLAAAPFDEAVNLLSRLPRERRIALVNALADPGRRRQLLRQQQYPAHSVGALVGDVPLRISASAAAADVLTELRALDAEDPGPLVIVDDGGLYLGILDRWRLLVADPPTGHVRDYLVEVRAVRPETPITSVAMNDDWHSRNWLPVVDHRRRVLGGVSRARVFRAATDYGVKSKDLAAELFADLVYAVEAILVGLLARKGRP